MNPFVGGDVKPAGPINGHAIAPIVAIERGEIASVAGGTVGTDVECDNRGIVGHV